MESSVANTGACTWSPAAVWGLAHHGLKGTSHQSCTAVHKYQRACSRPGLYVGVLDVLPSAGHPEQ